MALLLINQCCLMIMREQDLISMGLAFEKRLLPIHPYLAWILDTMVAFAFGDQLLAYWNRVECILQGLGEASGLSFDELALCPDTLGHLVGVKLSLTLLISTFMSKISSCSLEFRFRRL